MPYKIAENDNEYQVVNTDTGQVHGTHASRAKAMAQMRALYAAEGKSADLLDAVKSGARNSAADIERLRSIQQIVTELLGETIDEAEADDSPAEQLAEHLAELGGKSLNLAYAKSISMAPADVLAVKSIGADEIRGYVTLWGGPNITDIEREYFTQKTDFWDGTLGKSARPLTFDHAQDASFKADPVIGQMIDFGDDEIGRWYIAKLDRSHKYRKAIDRLISEGKLGTSSDSAPQYVERVKTGKSTWLKTWPLFAAALTDTPAEPRMIGSIEYYKSIGISLPDRVAVPWQFMTSITRRLKINP